MQTNLKKIQRRRIFSEELKRKVVKQYEKGEMTVLELSRFYEVSKTVVYRWIYKYSKFQKQSIKIVEMAKSSTQKIKELELKVKELERIVGVKQINIDFLDKMIEIAKKDYDIDIKKNFYTQQSTGLDGTKKK